MQPKAISLKDCYKNLLQTKKKPSRIDLQGLCKYFNSMYLIGMNIFKGLLIFFSIFYKHV